jgi:glycosyltransferase involved in cell wall biosynthesis
VSSFVPSTEEADMTEPWVPVRVADLDLLADPDGRDAGSDEAGPVLVLVRAHTRCLGTALVQVESGPGLAAHRDNLRREFADGLAAHASVFGCDLEPAADEPPCMVRRRTLLGHAPSVSVVIATHNRPHDLQSCLDTVLDQEHPALEVLVVDNARSNDDAERLVASEQFASRRVRYVREDRAGLGRAHNAGVRAARGDVVAITDDDVLVDRFWIAALLEAFAETDAGCVTGLILPRELRTREQSWVEQYGGFARGFRRRTFSLDDPPADDALFPFTAGRLGSGANMAFRRDTLDRIGGFDDALGAGTRAMGGDDLASFAMTVLAGETLTYEPDAVVRHRHHADLAALERMAHGYGVGLGAYLTSIVWSRPGLALEVARRVPAGVRHFTSRDSEKNKAIQSDYPRRLVLAERTGLLRGPLSYLASRWESRRHDDGVPAGGP